MPAGDPGNMFAPLRVLTARIRAARLSGLAGCFPHAGLYGVTAFEV
jgi:hypothetical protein